MFGWEFPPHIAGGLGTACYGMTRGLARNGVEVVFVMPRAYGDRPKVVPDGSVNLAFVGQFADTPRDTVFTTEYSIRTAMEAVYTLCNVDRGVPEVWGSVYDIRDLLYATSKLLDGKKPLEFLLPSVLPLLDLVKEPLVNNVVVDLLKKYNIV